jgi:hypothetical protein
MAVRPQGAGELLRVARRRIAEQTSQVLETCEVCPDSPEWPKGQMAAFPLPACDGAALQRRLAERDEYRVEVPVLGGMAGSWPPGVSVQGYNTARDVETLIDALAALLPQVSAAAVGGK